MKLNGGHLYRPDHTGQLRDAELVCMPARGEVHPYCFHPVRCPIGKSFLVDLLPFDAFGEPVQHTGALPEGPYYALPNAQVVVGQIQFRYTRGREIDPVRVRDL